jgi:uncharacterized protein (TIGR02145 family)
LFVLAVDDNYTVAKYDTLRVPRPSILVNDFYPNDLDSLVIRLVDGQGVLNGELIFDFADSSFVYIPNNGFVGLDGFQYEICGYRYPDMACDQAYVTIKVYDAPCPDMPIIGFNTGHICIGDSVELLSLRKPGYKDNDTVIFYTDNVYTQTYNDPYAKVERIYYARAFNRFGCYTDSYVFVRVFDLPITTVTVPDTAVCSNEDVPFLLKTLVVSNTDSLEFCTTMDFTTLLPNYFVVSSPDTVTIYVRSYNQITTCISTTDSLKITVNRQPLIDIIAPFTEFNCTNNNRGLVLKTNTTYCEECTYQWNGGVIPRNRDSVIVNSSMVLSEGTKFVVQVNNNTGCYSTDTVTITKNIVTPIPPVIDSTYQRFCEGAVVNNLSANGSVLWYKEPNSGTPISGNQLLVHDGIYYAATVTAGGCESTLRTYVKVGIFPPDELPAPHMQNQTLCVGTTVADILTSGNKGIAIYSSANGGSPLTSTTQLSTGTYYAGYSYGAGLCQSELRTTFYITINSGQATAPEVETPQSFCQGALLAHVKVPNQGIVWFADNRSNIPLPPDETLVSGTYYAAQTNGGVCDTSARVPVEIIIGGTIPPPVTYEPYLLCDDATIANINVSGYGITWYADRYSNTPLPLNMELTVGEHTFYVEVRGSNTCYSTTKAEVKVTVERCGRLLDCRDFPNRVVPADGYKQYQYTHNTTDWDISDAIMSELDSARYIVNGEIYTSGPDATLQGYIFPACENHVMVIAYFEELIDTCEFTVTVQLVCPDEVKDSEGNPYKVTKLAGLCWTENLKATLYDNGTSIAWAKAYRSMIYPDTVANADIFGLLYTWYSAVNLPEGSTFEITEFAPYICYNPNENEFGFVQGIGPQGWHSPSKAELESLNQFPAGDLKSEKYWLTPGIDLYGFDARPAGWFNGNMGRFENLYAFTGWWSTLSDNSGLMAKMFSFTYFCEHIMEDVKNKKDGLSVRCIMDY